MKIYEKKNKLASLRAAECVDNCRDEDFPRLTVNWVATRVNIHPSYLSRSFKQDIGCLLKDYIEQAKMKRACQLLLLETTDLKIKEIARRLDYCSAGYF
ncbi:MAG: helix-turn-helix transcriptional regulator, partial [bacterium]|nr:helix-turn-helix transcriptional regulator [bacterium]